MIPDKFTIEFEYNELVAIGKVGYYWIEEHSGCILNQDEAQTLHYIMSLAEKICNVLPDENDGSISFTVVVRRNHDGTLN